MVNRKVVSTVLIGLIVLSVFVSTFHIQVSATTLFSSGWENSGGSDATDDGVWTTASGSVSVDASYSHSGTYGLRFLMDATPAYTQKNLGSGYTELYVRSYFKFPSITLTSDSVTDVLGIRGTGYDWLAAATVLVSGGVAYFGLADYNMNYPSSTTGVTVDSNWHSLKLAYVKSASGFVKLYVDNELQGTINGNFSSLTSAQFVYVGWQYWGGVTLTGYADDVEVSDVDFVDYYPYIQQVSNIDSVADVGTHSNFTTQQYAPDSIYDTLTEANTFYNVTLETQTFEGDWPPTGWSESPANSRWNKDASQKHAGSYSAAYEVATANVGDLISPSYNLTGANALYLSFYYFDDDCDANEITYDYYDNATNWDNIGDLCSSTEDTFNNRINAKITDLQYLHGAFKFMIDGATIGSGENFYVDDFTVIAEFYNYTLALEEQFTNIADTGVAKLCIATGAFSSPAETLNAQVWNGTWNTVGSLTASQWNNFTVTSFLSDTNLYIRFIDGVTTADTVQSTWQIDSIYLWIYNDTSVTIRLDLNYTVTHSFTVSETVWFSRPLLAMTTGESFNALPKIKLNINPQLPIAPTYNIMPTSEFTLTTSWTSDLTFYSSLTKTFQLIIGWVSSLTFSVGVSWLAKNIVAFATSFQLNTLPTFHAHLSTIWQTAQTWSLNLQQVIMGKIVTLILSLQTSFSWFTNSISTFNLLNILESTTTWLAAPKSIFHLTPAWTTSASWVINIYQTIGAKIINLTLGLVSNFSWATDIITIISPTHIVTILLTMVTGHIFQLNFPFDTAYEDGFVLGAILAALIIGSLGISLLLLYVRRDDD